MLALNDHQFLVLARDSSVGETFPKTPGSVYRSVDLLDISGATNIAGSVYDNAGTPVAPLGALNSSIVPATYQKFLDINENAQLNCFGLHNGAPSDSNDLYEKWESLAVVPIGDRHAPNDYFLFVGSDNDFITQDGHMAGQPYKDASGANVDTLVLVYRVTLPTYVPPRPARFDLRSGAITTIATILTRLINASPSAAGPLRHEDRRPVVSTMPCRARPVDQAIICR